MYLQGDPKNFPMLDSYKSVISLVNFKNLGEFWYQQLQSYPKTVFRTFW